MCGQGASSQISTLEAWRFGISGSAALNMHTGPLTTYDGLQECGTFTETNTLGWTAGNMFWYRLSPNFALSARLQYWKADGDFTAANPVQPLVALSNGTTLPLQTNYSLATSLDYLTLDLVAQWYPLPNIYVALGPQVGFPMRTSFSQGEEIVSPAFMEFVNGGTQRTIYAADFATNNVSSTLRVAAMVGIGIDVHLAERFVISPEVSYTYSFTNVLSSSLWAVNSLRAGVHVAYSFGLPEAAPAVAAIAPVAAAEVAPVIAARPMPTIVVDLESSPANGTTVAGGDVLITELRSSDVVPLLPFVFFDVQRSEIPARYAKGKWTGQTEADLHDTVLGIYHELLNIVGSRMNTYTAARLTIGGYREPGDNENNASLSAARADAVKDYLVSTWGIDASRIDTRSGTLPSVVSNRGIADGRTENRRAELSSNDPRILAPVNNSSRESTIDPQKVRLISTITDRDQVTSISGSIVGDDGSKLSDVADGERGFEWTPNATSMQNLLGMRRSARATAHVTINTANGQSRVGQAPLTIRRDVRSVRYSNEVVNDSIIERFRLIFFDFDAPTVSAFNSSMVDLVRSRIRTTSSVRITGLTDRLGPVERNQGLSLARAQSIDASIKQRIVPERVSVKGAGPELIYNNDLPEGRLYNRTVLIEVATPVDSE